MPTVEVIGAKVAGAAGTVVYGGSDVALALGCCDGCVSSRCWCECAREGWRRPLLRGRPSSPCLLSPLPPGTAMLLRFLKRDGFERCGLALLFGCCPPRGGGSVTKVVWWVEVKGRMARNSDLRATRHDSAAANRGWEETASGPMWPIGGREVRILSTSIRAARTA